MEGDDAHHTLKAVLRSCPTSYRGHQREDVRDTDRAAPATKTRLLLFLLHHLEVASGNFNHKNRQSQAQKFVDEDGLKHRDQFVPSDVAE